MPNESKPPKPRTRVRKVMSGSTRTVQSEGPAQNLNSIMAKYQATGVHPPVRPNQPLYGDFTGPKDLHEMILRVDAAQAHFDALPAAVRKACHNDPVEFLEKFDEQDTELLVELGLVVEEVDDQAEQSPDPKPDDAPANPEPA